MCKNIFYLFLLYFIYYKFYFSTVNFYVVNYILKLTSCNNYLILDFCIAHKMS